MVRRQFLLAAVTSFVAAGASAQQSLWTVEGKYHAEAAGFALAHLPDRDGDRIPELLVGAPAAGLSVDQGIVRVLSGRDLSLLLEIGGERRRDVTVGTLPDQFGAAVATAGDLDRDGIEDLLVGAPSRDAVYLLAGSDGHEISKVAGNAVGGFGATVVSLGDTDGDGVVDFAVGAPREVGLGGTTGVVRVFSGATGFERFRAESTTDDGPASVFGERGRIADVGDHDGDGSRDLALLDIAVSPTTGAEATVARILSGATGVELLAIMLDGPTFTAFDFKSIAAAGDVDGDGRRDLAVGGVRMSGSASCIATLLSGGTGQELRRVTGPGNATWITVRGAFDVDGDGRSECLLACDGSSAATPNPSVRLYRGSDGVKLFEWMAASPLQYGRALLADGDYDGDGLIDLALGIPDLPDASVAPFGQFPSGGIETWSLPAGNALASATGRAEFEPANEVAAAIGDVDRDGHVDVAVALYQIVGANVIRVLSGRDGHVLGIHPIAVGSPIRIAAVPDLDGDGIDDYAVSINDFLNLAVIELRSSATGATIRTLTATTPDSSFGWPLVVGLQAGGAIEIAAGAPLAGSSQDGWIEVFDAKAGTSLFKKVGASGEQLGAAIAFLGDVNKDAVGDWAGGAPLSDANGADSGRVLVFSGVTGTTLKSFPGPAAAAWSGRALAAIGDLDGDGSSDLAVGAPNGGSLYQGEVRLLSGRNGAVLATYSGTNPNDLFGQNLLELDDVNGDGVEDFGISWTGQLDLISGASGGHLAILPETHVVAMARWQVKSPSSDRIGDLVIALPPYVVPEWPAGRFTLFALDDLMLQIDPDVAQQGDFVTAWLRGGRPNLPLLLELVALNGVRAGLVLTIDVFDGVGEWSISDIVPAGLAGITAELRGYGLDWNGKVMKSPVQPLEFK